MSTKSEVLPAVRDIEEKAIAALAKKESKAIIKLVQKRYIELQSAKAIVAKLEKQYEELLNTPLDQIPVKKYLKEIGHERYPGYNMC